MRRHAACVWSVRLHLHLHLDGMHGMHACTQHSRIRLCTVALHTRMHVQNSTYIDLYLTNDVSGNQVNLHGSRLNGHSVCDVYLSDASQMTREEIMAAIREDYSTNYFISGKGQMEGYAPDCVFADPFVSFAGTDRFKQNVGNLGGMM